MYTIWQCKMMFDQLNPVLKSTLALFYNNSLMLSLKYKSLKCKHGAYLKTSNIYIDAITCCFWDNNNWVTLVPRGVLHTPVSNLYRYVWRPNSSILQILLILKFKKMITEPFGVLWNCLVQLQGWEGIPEIFVPKVIRRVRRICGKFSYDDSTRVSRMGSSLSSKRVNPCIWFNVAQIYETHCE